jgi:glucose/arabinose dehydrogenase
MHALLRWSMAGAVVATAWLSHGREPASARQAPQGQTGVFSDYRQERPGLVRRITIADLPAPFATQSAENRPSKASRPAGALPTVLPGFSIAEYATGLENPRLVRTAPNGDLFVAESQPGRIKVLRGLTADGRAQTVETFATGLKRPFGIAFYPLGPNPQFVYVGNTDSVWRFPYTAGDLKARGPHEVVVPDIPGGGQLTGGGHWTRDIAFSRDGKTMFVSVGSRSNVDDTDGNAEEKDRADILAFTPDGKGRRVFAYGIRNPVGIAVNPSTGDLWASVNERDGLGDNLVPDYITHVQEGGFYGWPWFYMGGNQDPRHAGKHPELKQKVITPDVLLQPHSASLEMVFYEGTQFPASYRGHIFAAQHGSWNKTQRTGYNVVHVPVVDGKATNESTIFVGGFVTGDGQVWGRPVGVAVAQDGALIITDDASNTAWRVTHAGATR